MAKLSLPAVRNAAADADLYEVYFNEQSRVISFAPGNVYRGDTTLLTRMNVYYTTGTIATCLDHPVQGKTQLFRRNITDISVVRELMQDPRLHTGLGYHRADRTPKRRKTSARGTAAAELPAPLGEEEAAQAEIAALDIRARAIAEQRKTAEAVVAACRARWLL